MKLDQADLNRTNQVNLLGAIQKVRQLGRESSPKKVEKIDIGEDVQPESDVTYPKYFCVHFICNSNFALQYLMRP